MTSIPCWGSWHLSCSRIMINVMTINTTMFIVFNTWRCGFGCKYLALIWAFLHMRTFISPTHSPLTLFHWKGLGRSILTFCLTSYSFPILSSCWLFLGIFLGGNGDKLLASTTQNPWSIHSIMWHDFHDLWCVKVLPFFVAFCHAWTCTIAPIVII